MSFTVPDRIVVASANPAKASELEAVLAERFGPSVVLEPRPDWVPEIIEDAPDFEGNARLKAVALSDATGLTALADDSGLEVDGLGGRPGVRSARFAGEHATDADNIARLLLELSGVPLDDPRRRARFRSVLVLRWPQGQELVAQGTVEGRVGLVPLGTAGFGYDPVFLPLEDADGRTFAEMGPAQKNRISHRGRALAQLAEQLSAPGP